MDKKGFRSRLAFIQGQGIDTKDAYAWSYVNHAKKFVIFGAWNHHDIDSIRMIFSENWSHRGKRKQAGYTKSRPHIDLIIEENYELRTFPMKAKERTGTGPAEIEDWGADIERNELKQIGDDYFAVPLGTHEKEISSSSIVAPKDGYEEGHAYEVHATRYERDPIARSECIRHYGPICGVCDFDFEKKYGDLGLGFIHVHHRIRVADRPKPYKVDPLKDLVPVCPNCHAMIHKRVPPYSIEEMKAIFNP